MSLFRQAALSAMLLAAVPAAWSASQAQSGSSGMPREKQAAAVSDKYQQALRALRNGRVSEAHVLLRDHLQSKPEDLAACRLLAGLLLDNAQQAEAMQVLVAGHAQSAQSTDIALSLARLQADQGAKLLALQTLERSADYARQDAPYLAFMAALAAQTTQVERAIGLYQQALQLDASQGTWWLALGNLQRRASDMAGARRSYEMALLVSLSVDQQRQAKRALRQMAESQS